MSKKKTLFLSIGIISILVNRCFVLSAESPPSTSPKKMIFISAQGQGEENIEFDGFLYTVPFNNQSIKKPQEPEKKEPYIRNYAILFFDENGNVLLRFPFAYSLRELPPDIEVPMGKTIFDLSIYPFFFSGWLPFPEKTKKIVLEQDGKILATKERSVKPPRIKLGMPRDLGHEMIEVPWTVEDEDSDLLCFNISYSFPGGETVLCYDSVIRIRPKFEFAHRGELTTSLSDTLRFHVDSFRFNASGLPGGEGCKIHVRVSDGMNTEEAYSEPISVRIKPPNITIFEPKDGEVINEGEPVEFSAMALYSTGGSNEDFKLTWSSDIDGKLGEGIGFESPRFSNLSPGKHTITLYADDGKGCSGEKSMVLIVNETGKTKPDFTLLEESVKVMPEKVEIGKSFNVDVTVLGKNLYQGLPFNVPYRILKGEKEIYGYYDSGRVKNPDDESCYQKTLKMDAPAEVGKYQIAISVSCEFERFKNRKDNNVVRELEVIPKKPLVRDKSVSIKPGLNLRLSKENIKIPAGKIEPGQSFNIGVWVQGKGLAPDVSFYITLKIVKGHKEIYSQEGNVNLQEFVNKMKEDFKEHKLDYSKLVTDDSIIILVDNYPCTEDTDYPKEGGIFKCFSMSAPSEPGTYQVEVSVFCELEDPHNEKDNKVVKEFKVVPLKQLPLIELEK